MSEIYDIAVLGSGFAGSLLAMIATKLGRSVVMLERGTHPRFAIGESSTPLCNLLLDELATQYDLPKLKPLTKWGAWQREYPQVGCGLKRGFSFFHHDLNAPATSPMQWTDQMLVAASPHDEIADTHWYRADFDALLVEQAQEAGVVYQDEVKLQGFREENDHVTLSGTFNRREVIYRARFVVDATGPRGCLHQLLQLGERPVAGYPQTQALYSHFSGVKRLAEDHSIHSAGAPYPIDAAAVHHVFDGGWIWVLQFNNGLTSAGVAATAEAAERLGLARGEAAWQDLIRRVPALHRQFEHAVAQRPFRYQDSVCFHSAQIIGNRWALLPSAAGLIDPLFSTGFPLTLLGVKRIAALLGSSWESQNFEAMLPAYASATNDEFVQTANLIAALYANMRNFPAFRAVSLLYFAAASYSETVKRLGKPELAQSYMLHDDALFGPACRSLLAEARNGIATADTEDFIRRVKIAIKPFDLAGLTKVNPRHHYPVDANDLFASAWKIDSSREELAAMLARSGFYATVHS